MREYKVEVTRDGRWWMINVPEIDQLTQARRIGEIQEMAESLIHISTDFPLPEIKVHITSIDVRVSTDGRHSKWQHPSGVWVPVPDCHRTISPGVVRKVNKAIDESARARRHRRPCTRNRERP